MKTINANSTGAEFIQDLNDNFAECLAGADGTISVKVSMQGGDLKTSTGYVDGRWCAAGASNGVGTWTDDNFYKYLHTPCYLSLNGNKVKNVTVPSGSTLSIFCYDDTFTLLSSGVVNDEDNIPESTAYVKMQLYNPNGYAQVLALNIVLAAAPQWVKNTGVPSTAQWFNYECKPPKLWDDIPTCATPHTASVGDSADIDNTRYHDNGVVLLPTNYSPTGKPCPVVLFFNGDVAPWFVMHDAFHSSSGAQTTYEQNFKYLNACGYAVAMCTGYTSMWSGGEWATQVSKWYPRMSSAYVASANALYDHLMSNYNFDPRVYVAGKSAGGMMTLYLASMARFPVKAAAGFSVTTSMMNSLAQSSSYQVKVWQRLLGAQDWDDFLLNTGSYNSVSEMTRASILASQSSNAYKDAQRLIANEDYYRHLEPFTAASHIGFDAYLRQILSYDPFGQAEPTDFNNLIQTAYNGVKTPVKLWCATGDLATPYMMHKLYVDFVKASNGVAELRTYTGGSHNTFCSQSGGIVVNNLPTPYGVTMNGVNIGIVEAVEWFKRW